MQIYGNIRKPQRIFYYQIFKNRKLPYIMEKWNILLFKFNNDFSFPVGIYGESQVAFSGITIFFLVRVGDGMVFDADIGLGDVVAFHRDDFLGIFLDALSICIQDVDGHFQSLVLFAREGIDRIIPFAFLKLEAFGLDRKSVV